MAARKLTVVISQASGKNPVKRQLEEEIATRLMLSGVADVSLVPNLYDLTPDHTGMLWLKSLKGNLVVLGWLYPRAIRWVLDRNSVKGQVGESLLNVVETGDEAADEEQHAAEQAEADAPRGIGSLNVPNRQIFVIDLRDNPEPGTYLTEIERLAKALAEPLVQLGGLGGRSLLPILPSTPSANGAAATNGFQGTNGVHPSPATNNTPASNGSTATMLPPEQPPALTNFIGDEVVRRRWYPVIDYSRCTNCMECIDFCLFGVYGVDGADRILVEQQDNCKKGCPACSRVCPVNAIFFPEHKTPAIAGAEGGGATDFKIDLSKLFGAPSPLDMAILERDTELVADGRDAVGSTVGIPKRQCGQSTKPRDELDDLMDGLDSLDV